MFIIMFVYAITIVLIPAAIILFFVWRSMFKGATMARRNREYYKENFH